MSGTSVDGIDVAIVDFEGEHVSPVGHATIPWSADVRGRILSVSDAQCSTAQISRLSFELGELYAKAAIAACRTANIQVESLELAGCHGQTIYHEGGGKTPNTMQIGEAAVIAERLGVPVVSDFRVRDIAAGGQGAPLVPFADYLLFRSPNANRAALNIGGIANVTILPSAPAADRVTAFDTGPGNMVVDQLVERMTAGRRALRPQRRHRRARPHHHATSRFAADGPLLSRETAQDGGAGTVRRGVRRQSRSRARAA
jgi:anhydro-N-acetylmuramic acid kinase